MYKVGNYEFETKTQADTAQKELEGIRYIRSQTDMDDPDVVLQLPDIKRSFCDAGRL